MSSTGDVAGAPVSGRIFRVIQTIEEWLLAGGVLVMATLTIANVVWRTATGKSLAYAQEISQFAIILVTFIGAGYAASRGRHIRMTALYDQLPLRGRKALMLLITLSTAGLMFALTYFSIRYIGTVHALGTVSPVLRGAALPRLSGCAHRTGPGRHPVPPGVRQEPRRGRRVPVVRAEGRI